MSASEQCSRCRFWLIDQTTNGGEDHIEDGAIAFGFCRGNAPVVIGELAALCVPRTAWGRDPDRDEELRSTQIYRASTQPVTESADWCGKFDVTRKAG